MRQFWSEMENRFTWDLLPYEFLYDLYKAWFRRNCPSGSIQGRTTFNRNLVNVVNAPWMPTKTLTGSNTVVRSKGRMNRPELMIEEYDLTGWMSKTYMGSAPNRIAVPLNGIVKNQHGGLRPSRFLSCGNW